MKQLDASLWKRKDYGIHTMFSLPHRCFYCHHAVLVWRGALHDNTKNSCEGDCTMFGYGEQAEIPAGVHVYSECFCNLTVCFGKTKGLNQQMSTIM